MSKNIVLCADGTWNTPHGPTASVTDTNVRKLYMALVNDDKQLKYYDSGVGTDGTPLDHLTGGAMGKGGFAQNVGGVWRRVLNGLVPTAHRVCEIQGFLRSASR